MTSITIEKNGNQYDVAIQGHAGYCPGNDIVCAAVSTLTYTLAQAMLDMEDEGKIQCDMTLEPGNARFSLLPEDGGKEELNTAMRLITAGFRLLEHRYPENVCLKHGWEKE